MQLAAGARVLARDQEWLVLGTNPASCGGEAVRVRGLSELVREREAIFLTALDTVVPLAPEETDLVPDDSPRYRRSRLYLEALLRRTPPTGEALVAGHRGAMDSSEYQLVPAHKALQQLRPRLLIADAVGLGKTVEVGIMLSELIQRGHGERILVVTLKSILTQFQEELWSRFAIPLTRLDSVGIQRVQQKLPANQNPFFYFNRVIISIDTLKKDEKYRRYLEHCRWDVIVVDECQHVAERSKTLGGLSQRARLARLLASTSDALILTSATPHDGRPESFASLMKLLEPTAIADPSNYTRDEVESLFVRRFKKDVAVHFPERIVKLEQSDAGLEEEAVLTNLQSFPSSEPLFRVTLLKAFLSSPWALLESLRHRLKKRPGEAEPLLRLQKLTEQVTLEKFGKWNRLVELLRQLGYGADGKRVVIFSERLETLRQLRTELIKQFKLKPESVGLFYGTADDQVQQQIVKDFSQAQGDIRILLASDAASEGINMHEHCHHMIHFDVPWSLITLEQRNGRIDRYGQQQPPDIRYLLTVPRSSSLRGDLRIIERLIEKESEAQKNLGDVAWLMNLHEAQKEEQRVALAIDRHEPAEQVIPDQPALDEEEDFLSVLLSGGASAKKDIVPVEDPLRFYPDDFHYAQAALGQLSDELRSRGQEPLEVSWEKHLKQSFVLGLTPELEHRFAYLPRELRPDDGRLRLTCDREFLLQQRGQSRAQGQWPTWSLFWDAHPVAQWLSDRVLSQFARHEAPVLRVTRGLPAGQSAFVIQGVFSNQRSQPVLVEWLAVLVDSTGKPLRAVPWQDLAREAGLHEELQNPGAVAPPPNLKNWRARVVQWAKEELKLRRERRAAGLLARLKEETRKLNAWEQRSRVLLQTQEALPNLTSVQRQRLAREREELQRIANERREYVQKSLTTVAEPYIRLVAVLLGPA
jgi:superfamily II DNA or RNA helicase